MICATCRRQIHRGCRGETWCDCQHRGHEFNPNEIATSDLTIVMDGSLELEEETVGSEG